MTNEEAIKYIIRHCNPDYPNGKTKWETAINMAIEALKAQSGKDINVLGKDTVYRQDAIDAVEFGITYAKAFDTKTGEMTELFKDRNEELRKAVKRLRELPPAQPNVHDLPKDADCISRQAAITIPVMPKEHRHYQTNNLDDAYDQGWFDLQNCIEHISSAEPEIIRCKNCKHYQFADNRAFGMPVKMCKWFGFEDVDDDDFCSRAERRTERE